VHHYPVKSVRTTNRNARDYVRNGVPFQNSNGQLFGRWETAKLFVVYSYGEHWPLFVWDDGIWLENEDKCSPTTSRHHTQAHPHKETTKVSRNALRAIVTEHITNHINERNTARQLERFQRDIGLAA